MTEFIEQLRAHECEGQFASDCCKDVCGEAADEIERLTAEVRKLELQQRIHIGTIRDLQCGAMNYLTYPHDGERRGLDSAVKASLCIVPLEDDDAPVSGSPTHPDRPRRLDLKEGRGHLTVTNEFQSDKYPWCPAGFVPLKITDPMAKDSLWDYARRRQVVDSEFSCDLEEALAYSAANPDDSSHGLPGTNACSNDWHRNKCVATERCPDCKMTTTEFNSIIADIRHAATDDSRECQHDWFKPMGRLHWECRNCSKISATAPVKDGEFHK